MYTCFDMLPLTSDQVFTTLRRPLWWFLLSATAASPLLCQETIEVEVRRGVLYATHDGVQLSGDHYVPKQPGKYPVVVAVHGGGWQLGSKAELQNWGQYLASHGIACFSIGYRLSKPGQRNYPKPVLDVRAAVQFVRYKADELKIDPDRVGLIGNSAGAHLAALVALAGDSNLSWGGMRRIHTLHEHQHESRRGGLWCL